ncbi:MAG: NADH-quinone oxidoreductase subunit NuoE [Syntrophobacterales bacterium]|nr:MAG: NADH-quinone oxidoreductase subunit NuoE [Syntrophobacterales bacterium]
MSDVKISPDNTPDLTQLDPILDEYRGQKGAVIPVLQKAQKIYGYLPPEVLRRIAAGMRVPLSKIYGVATFYSQFYLTRRGRHIVRQCDGTACHVRGAGKIVDRMEQELGVRAGQTTADYRVTCEVVYCLGSCGLAPVAMVNEQTIGKLAPEKMTAILRSLD